MTWISNKWQIKFIYAELKINWIHMVMKESIWIEIDINWSGKMKINIRSI